MRTRRGRYSVVSASALALAAIGWLGWIMRWHVPRRALSLANSTYQVTPTQLVVSVVFTNTTRHPLACARNSLVEYVTADDVVTRNFNNDCKPDPLLLRPGQIGSYQVRLPADTAQFQITTPFAEMAWRWLAYSAIPEKWIPHPIGRALGERMVRSMRFAPVTGPLIVTGREKAQGETAITPPGPPE